MPTRRPNSKEWNGDVALTLACRAFLGDLGSEMLYRGREPFIQVTCEPAFKVANATYDLGERSGRSRWGARTMDLGGGEVGK